MKQIERPVMRRDQIGVVHLTHFIIEFRNSRSKSRKALFLPDSYPESQLFTIKPIMLSRSNSPQPKPPALHLPKQEL